MTTKFKHIDQIILKSLLDYNELTGVFTWKKPTDARILCGTVAGRIYSAGYREIEIGGVYYRANRLAFIWMLGNAPDEVDHKNKIRSDDRWCNLRSATRAQNVQNSNVRIDNKLGVRGVSFRRGYYCAKVTPITGPMIIKTFKTLKDAKEFVEKHRRIEHGDFACD